MPTFSEYLDSLGARGQRFNRRMKEIYGDFLENDSGSDKITGSDMLNLFGQSGRAYGNTLGTLGGGVNDTIGVTADYAVPDAVSEPLVNGLNTALKYSGAGLAGRAAKGLFEQAGGMELVKDLQAGYQQLPQSTREGLEDIGNMFTSWFGRGAIPFRDPAMKGYALSGVNNLIDGWYGVANIKLPPALDSLTTKLSGSIAAKGNLSKEQAKQVSDSITRAAAVATYGTRAMRDFVRYQVDPVARALYRSTGANPEAMRLAQNLMAEKGGKLNWQDYDRIVQQAYYGRHIKNQRGRKGGASQVVQRLENIPVLADATVPVGQKGFYKAMSAPYSEEVVPDSIYNALESHLRNIPSWKKTWEKPTNVVLKDVAVIGGDHMYDYYNKLGYPDIVKVFKNLKKNTGETSFKDYDSLRQALYYLSNKKVANSSLKAIAKTAIKSKGKNLTPEKVAPINVIPTSRLTPEMKEAGGVWVTLGKVGSSITEGGVNVVYRVDLDGTVVGMLSDKHDFIEKATDKMFKQNQMAVTQPFVKNVWSGKGFNNTRANPDVKAAAAKAAVEDFVSLEPSISDLTYEYSGLANKLLQSSKDNEKQKSVEVVLDN